MHNSKNENIKWTKYFSFLLGTFILLFILEHSKFVDIDLCVSHVDVQVIQYYDEYGIPVRKTQGIYTKLCGKTLLKDDIALETLTGSQFQIKWYHYEKFRIIAAWYDWRTIFLFGWLFNY